jgi:hypothetical protein
MLNDRVRQTFEAQYNDVSVQNKRKVAKKSTTKKLQGIL